MNNNIDNPIVRGGDISRDQLKELGYNFSCFLREDQIWKNNQTILILALNDERNDLFETIFVQNKTEENSFSSN